MVSEALEKKLYDAASKGDVTTLVRLVEEDPYLVHGVSFPCSRNLLHIAAMHGQTAVVEEVLKLNPRLARISDSQKSSPLHIAVEEGHVEISKKLFSVAPEACWWRDCHDMNPLHIAAMKGHIEIVEYLIEHNHMLAKERLHRGETVLHLCVKHGQLMPLKVFVDKLGKEVVDATDEDGETIMHLAARCNQFEIIQYLVESKSIKRQTHNSMGKTELHILDESPPGTTSRYSEIRRVLSSLSSPSMNNVLPEMTNTMMVVVVLIATMAFQNIINPPGGVWPDDTSSHNAGYAVIAYTQPYMYKYLVCVNTIAFVSSILTVLLIGIGGPSKNFNLLMIALSAMGMSLVSIAMSYVTSTIAITPNTKTKSLGFIVLGLLVVSYVIAIVMSFAIYLAILFFNLKTKIRG